MLVYERPIEICRDFVPNDAVLAVATTELNFVFTAGGPARDFFSGFAAIPKVTAVKHWLTSWGGHRRTRSGSIILRLAPSLQKTVGVLTWRGKKL